MEICEYCGNSVKNSKYDSQTNLFRKEKNKNDSWLCLPKWCSGESERESEITEITTENVPKYGQYNRRKTIHFDLDSPNGAASKPTAKGRQSILKPPAGNKVRKTCVEIQLMRVWNHARNIVLF